MSIIEIREFIDEEGSFTRSEVVDVEDEMNGVLSKVEQYKATMKAAKGNQDGNSKADNDDLDIEMLAKSMRESINPTVASLDDEMKFVRELAEIADSVGDSRDVEDDEWLTALERKEMPHTTSSSNIESSTTSSSRIKSSENQTKDVQSKSKSSTSTSLGWKKGFLGNEKKKADTSSNVISSKIESTNDQSKDKEKKSVVFADNIESSDISEQTAQNVESKSILKASTLPMPTEPDKADLKPSPTPQPTTTTSNRPKAFNALPLDDTFMISRQLPKLTYS